MPQINKKLIQAKQEKWTSPVFRSMAMVHFLDAVGYISA